jgi:hypothetical protein
MCEHRELAVDFKRIELHLCLAVHELGEAEVPVVPQQAPGFGARLINPVPNKQPATNSEDDSWYQTSGSPALSDFGFLGGA